MTVDRNEILASIQDKLADILDLDDLDLSEAMAASDVAGWDSINNVRLLMGLEMTYGVEFGAADVTQLKNVGDLVSLIERKAG